jgi:CarD family transcriptional regulator
MPSAKKIDPSPKTKAALTKAKSSKRRDSQPGSKTTNNAKITKSKESRVVKTKEAVSKERARASLAAKKGSANKVAAKKSSTSESKKAATRDSSAKNAAKRESSASLKNAAKGASMVKMARSRARVGSSAVKAAQASTRKASRKPASVAAPKQADKKTSAVKNLPPREKLEKAIAAVSHVAKRKSSSRIEAGVKAPRSGNATVVRSEAVVNPGKENFVSETVVALPSEKGQATGGGEPVAPKSEPLTITLETSDHQPVTQKIQKKTAADSAPVADIAAPAADKAVASQPPVKAAPAKPAPERTEGKVGDVNGAALPAGENKLEKSAAASKSAVKSSSSKPGFKTMEFIVYPAHGVGQIIAIEEQEVAGFKLELYVISFIKDKMILKVPTPKAASVGMRKLGSADVIKKALATLTGRARVKRTMWSRRAQEYEAKINSGDLVAIAEVVRDLYRSEAQPEQSYSERQLYEAALDRVAREISVVQKLTDTESLRLIESQLQKGPRRTKAEDAEGEVADGDADDDGDIDEAA